jgi:ATP-binding cassette, subfamily B, bacterial
MALAADKQEASKQSARTIIDNNLFLLKTAFRHTPLFVIGACVYPAFHAAVIYVEHTLGIKLVTDAIQYEEPFSKVVTYIVIICLFILAALVMGRIYYHVIQPKGLEKLHLKIKQELYDKAAQIDLACYDDPDYYNEFVLSIQEVQNRVQKTIEYLNNMSSNLVYVIMVSGFFILMDATGLIFVAASVISTLFISLVLNKLRYKMRLELNAQERKRNYVNRVFYLADYAKELRLHDVTGKLQEDFRASNSEIRETVRRYSGKMLLLSFVERFVCNSFILDGLYLLYIAFMTLVKNAFSYGGAVALINSAWRLNGSVQQLSRLVSDFQENSLYIEKIRRFLAYEEQVVERVDAIAPPDAPALLELRNVSFAYSPEAGPILRNLSLTIRPNERIALVGYNGAGKTTLVKLLMRLYDVTEGQILLNGRDIRDYKLEDYRRSFGSVFQDYQLFAASIAENVLMDQVSDMAAEREKVESALVRSGFQDRLQSLEQGIETPLTREFEESGTNLSGGEAQKVAIARAFAKPSHYMILDEPSSALDPISEYHMNQSMLEAAGNKTVFFISHRLSTTRMADRICMMEKGEIIEQGTHDELIALNGKYAEMFNLQAERYRLVAGG